LRRDRWPPHLRVQPIEVLRHSAQDRIHQLPHPTQRMIRWNPFFQRHIAEHPGLQMLIVSSHPCFLPHFFSLPAVAFSTSSYAALVEKGMRPSMARLTLARKIAAITLIIWKKGVSFDPKQLQRQAA